MAEVPLVAKYIMIYDCPTCSKTFINSQALNAHQRSHTKYKQPKHIKCCSLLTRKEIPVNVLKFHEQNYRKYLKSCKECGISFSDKRKIFCSTKCSITRSNNRKSLLCNFRKVSDKIIFKYKKKKYKTLIEKQKAYRAMHNEAWTRYMAKKKYQTPATADVKAIQKFYKNCPEDCEVDHIIPISKGGLHDLSNLQYLTSLENKRKSNKLNWQG